MKREKCKVLSIVLALVLIVGSLGVGRVKVAADEAAGTDLTFSIPSILFYESGSQMLSKAQSSLEGYKYGDIHWYIAKSKWDEPICEGVIDKIYVTNSNSISIPNDAVSAIMNDRDYKFYMEATDKYGTTYSNDTQLGSSKENDPVLGDFSLLDWTPFSVAGRVPELKSAGIVLCPVTDGDMGPDITVNITYVDGDISSLSTEVPESDILTARTVTFNRKGRYTELSLGASCNGISPTSGAILYQKNNNSDPAYKPADSDAIGYDSTSNKFIVKTIPTDAEVLDLYIWGYKVPENREVTVNIHYHLGTVSSEGSITLEEELLDTKTYTSSGNKSDNTLQKKIDKYYLVAVAVSTGDAIRVVQDEHYDFETDTEGDSNRVGVSDPRMIVYKISEVLGFDGVHLVVAKDGSTRGGLGYDVFGFDMYPSKFTDDVSTVDLYAIYTKDTKNVTINYIVQDGEDLYYDTESVEVWPYSSDYIGNETEAAAYSAEAALTSLGAKKFDSFGIPKTKGVDWTGVDTKKPEDIDLSRRYVREGSDEWTLEVSQESQLARKDSPAPLNLDEVTLPDCKRPEYAPNITLYVIGKAIPADPPQEETHDEPQEEQQYFIYYPIISPQTEEEEPEPTPEVIEETIHEEIVEEELTEDEIEAEEDEIPQAHAANLNLDENGTPQGYIPKTGTIAVGVIYSIGATLISVGGLLTYKSHRKEEE